MEFRINLQREQHDFCAETTAYNLNRKKHQRSAFSFRRKAESKLHDIGRLCQFHDLGHGHVEGEKKQNKPVMSRREKPRCTATARWPPRTAKWSGCLRVPSREDTATSALRATRSSTRGRLPFEEAKWSGSTPSSPCPATAVLFSRRGSSSRCAGFFPFVSAATTRVRAGGRGKS